MADDVIVRIATREDFEAIVGVMADIFDYSPDSALTREFLGDPRHHLFLAFVEERIVGIASGFHYIHPDKKPEMFVNEVGVHPKYQNQRIGRRLVKALCDHGKTLGCVSAWVATETDNIAAQKAYAAAGGKLDVKPFVLFEFELSD